MERAHVVRVGLPPLLAGFFCAASFAAEEAKPPGATVLLDTKTSAWRCRMVRATSEFLTGPGKVERVVYRNTTRKRHTLWREKKVLEPGDYKIAGLKEYRLPEATDPDWMQAGFDDSEWCRRRGATGAGSDPGWKLMLMRGRFDVNDPAKCKGLKLSATYRGGIVVYVNGTEVARRHLPEGKLDLYALAEPYPSAMYLTREGRLRQRPGRKVKGAKPLTDFNRTIEDVSVPASVLRKGVNVLAVAAHRAPTDKAVLLRADKRGHHITRHGPDVGWSTVGIMGVRLTAPPGSGATPGAAAGLPGLAVWNASDVQNVFRIESGPGLVSLRPVRMVAPRGGAGIAQVIAGAPGMLKKLSVQATDLQGPGRLSVASVQVRYGMPDGYISPTGDRPMFPTSFDSLADVPPAEIKADEKTGLAIQPLWITVNVPRATKPGEYAGKLTVSAAERDPVEVPLVLGVAEWALPPIDEYATHNDIVQSPESVAIRYGVEMWSDEHFALLDRTFRLLAPLGDKTLYITAVRRTHWGNEQAMVRWTRGKEGSLDPDLSIAEKYVDAARKHMGRIPSVILYAWEPPSSMGHAGNPGAISRAHDRPILLTLKSKRSGRLRAITGPAWGSPESRELWSKLVKGMNELLAKRGMKDSLLFGMVGDHRPTRRAMAEISTAAPGTLWACHSHFYATEHNGYKMGMCAAVWGIGCRPTTPEQPGGYGYGWRSDFRLMTCSRYLPSERTSLDRVRTIVENWLGAHNGRDPQLNGCKGLGRAGADFWPVLKDSRGNYRGRLAARYPESAWGQLSLLNCTVALLAPGKEGPLSTVRAENIRAGVQEIEARVFIERALLDKDARARLGDELADRCRKAIDNRIRAAYYGGTFFVGSGYRKRAELLYDLAHQVAVKTGKEG